MLIHCCFHLLQVIGLELLRSKPIKINQCGGDEVANYIAKMDSSRKRQNCRRNEWRFGERSFVVILYITLLVVQTNCQSQSHESLTKTVNNIDKVDNSNCHSCQSSSNDKIDVETVRNFNVSDNDITDKEDVIEDVLEILGTITKRYILVNMTETQLETEVERILSNVLSTDRYEIAEGVEIKTVENDIDKQADKRNDEGRALFSKFSYEYRLYQKFKNFVDTHVLSINLPKAAKLMGFRCKSFYHIYYHLFVLDASQTQFTVRTALSP